MRVTLDLDSTEDYRLFLKIKSLPRYSFTGRTAEFSDEYATQLGLPTATPATQEYCPSPFLFDYQRDLTALAIRRRLFALFAECGLGKSLMLLDWCRHVQQVTPGGRVLVVSPLMVVGQTIREAAKFYGNKLRCERVPAAKLNDWLATSGEAVGFTNYEAITERVQPGRLAALVLDESSMLKSHYGRWGARLIEMGKGLQWKLCLTGTPAPNDRIEYANHAVFLDQVPTVNAFLATYFVNRGQTDNRWELKPHALRPFYRSLSHWCVFLHRPHLYGWKDNTAPLPPLHVHVHDVPLSDEQMHMSQVATGCLFADSPGGIVGRAKLSQIAKGTYQGKIVETNKTEYIRQLVDSWPDEQTIIWCLYNGEQDLIEVAFPEAAAIRGDTPLAAREQMIADFQSGRRRVLISKPKVLGFGLNLQAATRHVFSGLQDSWESFHQAVKRSSRIGSTRSLNVHIPVTEIERPMLETVLKKARRVQQDTEEQEAIFLEVNRV